MTVDELEPKEASGSVNWRWVGATAVGLIIVLLGTWAVQVNTTLAAQQTRIHTLETEDELSKEQRKILRESLDKMDRKLDTLLGEMRRISEELEAHRELGEPRRRR